MLTRKPTTRREQVDAVRLKAAGSPAHINAGEARLLKREMPAAAGPVITHGLLAEAGIKGDDRVTNLIPAEKNLLKSRGGVGTPNRATGLLQYYGDGTSDDSSYGGGNGGLGAAATGTNNSRGDGGNNTYSGHDGWGGELSYSGPLGTYAGPRTTEDFLNTPDGFRAEGYDDLGMMQYAPPDTWTRAFQTGWYGPPRDYARTVPGRFDAPNARGPGIAGTAANMMTGGLLGGMMNLGGIFSASMSPETRDRSMAENQAQGSKNSTGNETGLSGVSDDAAGSSSGAATAKLLKVNRDGAVDTSGKAAGGGTLVAPGGTSIAPDNKSSTLTGLPLPIQSILADYIWRGRVGSGW
jgi:hypothetical protein